MCWGEAPQQLKAPCQCEVHVSALRNIWGCYCFQEKVTNTPGEMSQQEPCGITGLQKKQQADKMQISCPLRPPWYFNNFTSMQRHTDSHCGKTSRHSWCVLSTFTIIIIMMMFNCSCDLELLKQCTSTTLLQKTLQSRDRLPSVQRELN